MTNSCRDEVPNPEMDRLRAELQARIDDHEMVRAFVGEQLGIGQPLPAVTSIGCVKALVEMRSDASPTTARDGSAMVNAGYKDLVEALGAALNIPPAATARGDEIRDRIVVERARIARIATQTATSADEARQSATWLRRRVKEVPIGGYAEAVAVSSPADGA